MLIIIISKFNFSSQSNVKMYKSFMMKNSKPWCHDNVFHGHNCKLPFVSSSINLKLNGVSNQYDGESSYYFDRKIIFNQSFYIQLKHSLLNCVEVVLKSYNKKQEMKEKVEH